METNRATEYMAQGHVCAEAVLHATCDEFGIEQPEGGVPRIAHFFAGGIGNTGSVCGAVAGAVMAMGLLTKPGETMEEELEQLSLAGEFRRRFEGEMKSIQCRDLTGVDLSTPEGIEIFMRSDIPEKVCFPAVATAHRLVVELLNEVR